MLAALGLGAALVLAFPPFGGWFLAPLAFGGLALLLVRSGVGLGALVGFAFGTGFFLPLLHWSGIYVGALPWILLALSQAAPVALFGALAALVSRLPVWPLWIAALWVAQEALRSRAPFGGFPWGELAFSQSGGPSARLAALGGAPLVGFAVALSGAFLAAAIDRGARRSVRSSGVLSIAAILVALSGLVVPPNRPSGRAITVAVVQGNVPRLGLDFNAQRMAVLRNHVEATLDLAERVRSGKSAKPDLVIWPENSSDIDPLSDHSAGHLIDSASRAVGVPILVGAVVDGPGRNLSNDGIVWDPATGPGQRYVKRHPVPFGEYIPMRSLARVFSTKVDRVARDFLGGGRPGVLAVGPARVGDVICFEVAYDGVVRDTVRRGADLLVVQTNNATFGRSGESEQQLAMGRLRAIEHDRTLVVSSTSGISAVISPDGRVVRRTGTFTRSLIVESVRLSKQSTLATRVGAWPEWLLVGTALVAACVAVVQRRRNRRRQA